MPRPPTATSRRSVRSQPSSSRSPSSARSAARPPVHDLDAPAGGKPQARLQPEADDVGRPAAVRGCRDPGWPGRADHLHADRLDRPSAGVAMGEAREVIADRFGDAYTMPKGRRLQDQGQGRPGGARGDPADQLRARPGLAGRHAQAVTRLRLYRLIWQRALASPDGGQGAGDDDRRAGGRATVFGRARRRRSSTASAGSIPKAGTTSAEEAERRAADAGRG